ncbi:histone acetyltransferase HAC12-like [Apium graveolens]|uniref:histone acetyltransferase HAC12-like n=1 Tax=Apium graveolens TaxID=4045 RepID=UPI003D7BE0D3
MDNNSVRFISNNGNYDRRIQNSSSIDRANRFRLNNTGDDGVRRGWSDVVAARKRNLWTMANMGSREEYINLKRAGPYAKKVILQEMWHIAKQANMMTSLSQPTSSREIPPGFSAYNSIDPRVNYMEASHSNLHTSTPNVNSGSGFHDGSLFKGYRQEVASRITPINRNMQGIEQVVSNINSSPEQASSITICSNEDACSAKKSSYSGSILQSSSQCIVQPSPEHHTKIPTINHGSLTTEANNSRPLESNEIELCNQIASVNLPKQNSGLESVVPKTTAISSNLTMWQNFLQRYHSYKIKYVDMPNNKASFLSIVHEKLCVSQCKCELYSRIISHYDKCAHSNCRLCVEVRKLCDNSEVRKESSKRKNANASAFRNMESNGTVTDESNQTLRPSKCQKLENSNLASDKTTRNIPLGSPLFPVKELLSNTDDQNHESKMKMKGHKIQGVSLTDFFTVGELEEHLRSFGQWIGQEVRPDHSLCPNKCQLCAMDKLEFAPAPMYCLCCRSPIRHDLIYYQVIDELGAKHCFCSTCHRLSRKTILSFPKTKLQKEKNNLKTEESWVQCDKCEGWQHQICALYNDKRDPGGKAAYICPKCRLQELKAKEGQPLSKTASLYAKDLPRSMLSDHIEERLFKRLRKEREEISKDLSKNLGEVPEEADFSVRVVLSIDKELEVNKKFLDIFHESNYPEKFPYRSKMILLFQRIEGVDVCIFGMNVQEFGSNCDQPNQRCVYISYIDSIKYLRPEMKIVTGEALRTVVYHEILIGYLDYCKKRGFSTCYIWACPPLKGDDYIFYCHPESQRIPKADKLQQWYELMFKKAVKENIAVDCTNFYDHFFLSSGGYTTKTAACLPYFEGAYWSSTAESIVGTIEQDGKEPKLTKAALKAMGHNTSPSDASRKDVVVMEKACT